MMDRRQPTGDARPDSRGRTRLRAAATALATVCALSGAATTASAQSGNPAGATTIGALIEGIFSPPGYDPNDFAYLGTAEQQQAFVDRVTASREGIAIGVNNAIASFPLGASSAGFTYSTNPTTGERELRAVSFGPVFVERALTNGKGVFNLGFAYQGGHYSTLQGRDLENDGIVAQQQRGTFVSDGSDVGDTWRSHLAMDGKVFLVSGSYGVSDNFDIGWSVPFVSLSAQARFIRDYNGGLDYDRNLSFIDPNAGPTQGQRVFIRDRYPNKAGTQTLVDRTIDASGLGDIILRAKYAFGPQEGQRVLFSGDVRLPTGDEENLLGTGKASVRAIVGTSRRLGENASFNANGGFTVGGLTDEINFSLGTEVAVLPAKQMTLTFDFIGQNLRDAVVDVDSLVTFDRVNSNLADGFQPRRVIVSAEAFARGQTTLLRAAIGAKYALGGNWLLTGSALFRLNDNGFQAKVIPFVGIEHTWAPK
jgi:hypothetical protein